MAGAAHEEMQQYRVRIEGMSSQLSQLQKQVRKNAQTPKKRMDFRRSFIFNLDRLVTDLRFS